MHCGYTVITPTQQPHVVNILYAQRNDAEDEVSQLPCMPPALWLLLLMLSLAGRVDVDVGVVAT